MLPTLALRVPGRPDPARAKALAHAVKEAAGWGALEVEIFPGREESLLLIHPAAGIYIAEGALALLADRLDDETQKTP